MHVHATKNSYTHSIHLTVHQGPNTTALNTERRAGQKCTRPQENNDTVLPGNEVVGHVGSTSGWLAWRPDCFTAVVPRLLSDLRPCFLVSPLGSGTVQRSVEAGWVGTETQRMLHSLTVHLNGTGSLAYLSENRFIDVGEAHL